MRALLIPSAVLMPKDMQKSFGELPTALFPLGDVPMLSHLYSKYKHSVDKIYVVVYEKSELVEKYIVSKKLPIELIKLDKLSDLGYTIRFGVKEIFKWNEQIDYLYINFADSLLDDGLPKDGTDFSYYSLIDTIAEWTYFQATNGHIINLVDKSAVKNNMLSMKTLNQVFVGVFGIANPLLFAECMAKEIDIELLQTDDFYKALYQYSHQIKMDFIETKNWFDVGHNENYIKAKTKVAARSFNTIKIDEQRGILRKTSQNKEKLIDEIRWYLRLPNKLQYLLPRIYDYSLDLEDPYVSMEYYGYHTLHESLLYGDLAANHWWDIFKKLKFVISDMEKFKVVNQHEDFKDAIYDIYVKKTFDRLNKIRHKREFEPFFENNIIINGEQYKSLNEYVTLLPKLVESLLMKDLGDKFNIIHGDLCFTNILIEDSYNFMRFIDPRGRFGPFDIYGDSRYEIAKLLHTLEGGYDFIIEDMFDVTVNGTEIQYKIYGRNDEIYSIFLEVFQEKLQDIQAIRLIEATLFLSMIPLHSDSLLRQYIMLATGIYLIDSVIKHKEKQNG